HDLVHISGSLVLSLAIFHQEMDVESVWEAAQVDEIWQSEFWGEDEDAAAAATKKRASFVFAAKLLDSVADHAY
ncbi:MAG: ATPase, partial [Amylibacter sp.]|nr:ATPase [Amylibacter sp.]